MENKIEHLEKQIAVYNKALGEIKDQLALKRTEMANLANLTVFQMNQEIPKLQETVNNLNMEVLRLEGIIKDKQEKYQAQRDSCTEEFNALKESLANENNRRVVELASLKEEAQKVKEYYLLKSNELSNSENNLNDKRTTLENERSIHAENIAQFEQKKSCVDKEIKQATAGIFERGEQVRLLEVKAAEDRLTLDKEFAFLAEQKKQTADILARIDEANKILAIAASKEEENKKRAEDLNALNTKVMADRKKNSLRSDDLNTFEKNLNARLENLKILEAEKTKV